MLLLLRRLKEALAQPVNEVLSAVQQEAGLEGLEHAAAVATVAGLAAAAAPAVPGSPRVSNKAASIASIPSRAHLPLPRVALDLATTVERIQSVRAALGALGFINCSCCWGGGAGSQGDSTVLEPGTAAVTAPPTVLPPHQVLHCLLYCCCRALSSPTPRCPTAPWSLPPTPS